MGMGKLFSKKGNKEKKRQTVSVSRDYSCSCNNLCRSIQLQNLFQIQPGEAQCRINLLTTEKKWFQTSYLTPTSPVAADYVHHPPMCSLYTATAAAPQLQAAAQRI